MYVLVEKEDIGTLFFGIFSSTEKAKEALEQYFDAIQIEGQAIMKPTYKYEDAGYGCFKVFISGWGESVYELLLPPIDQYYEDK